MAKNRDTNQEFVRITREELPMKRRFFFLLATALLVSLAAYAASPRTGQRDAASSKSAMSTCPTSVCVQLWEGTHLTKDIVCIKRDLQLQLPYDQTFNFQSGGGCANDEASSIEFFNMPGGSIVRLYDDPRCHGDDDYVVFTFELDVPRTWSSDLERTRDDYDFGGGKRVYTQHFYHHNGLNGKVSCMMIHVPAPKV